MRALALFCCALPGQLFAEQASTDIAMIEPLSTGYLIKLTGGLVVVVVIIFALAWLLKRFKLTQYSGDGLLKVVAGLPIGTRERIVVLQVGEEQILLGLSLGRIQKLHTLSRPIGHTKSDTTETAFGDKFQKILNARRTE